MELSELNFFWSLDLFTHHIFFSFFNAQMRNFEIEKHQIQNPANI